MLKLFWYRVPFGHAIIVILASDLLGEQAIHGLPVQVETCIYCAHLSVLTLSHCFMGKGFESTEKKPTSRLKRIKISSGMQSCEKDDQKKKKNTAKVDVAVTLLNVGLSYIYTDNNVTS